MLFYIDQLAKDGETIDVWTFTNCRYTAIKVGSQVHATKDTTQETGDIHKIDKDENVKFVLIRAGQHG